MATQWMRNLDMDEITKINNLITEEIESPIPTKNWDSLKNTKPNVIEETHKASLNIYENKLQRKIDEIKNTIRRLRKLSHNELLEEVSQEKLEQLFKEIRIDLKRCEEDYGIDL